LNLKTWTGSILRISCSWFFESLSKKVEKEEGGDP
jgi:hypothetical protein